MTDQPSEPPRRKMNLAEYSRLREKCGKIGPLVLEHSRGEDTNEGMVDAGGDHVAPTVIESDTMGEAMEVDQKNSGIEAAAPSGTMAAPEPPYAGPVNWLRADPKTLEVLPPGLRHKSASAVEGASSSKAPLNVASETSVQSPVEREQTIVALLRRIDAEYADGYPPIQIIPPTPVAQYKGKGKDKTRAIDVNNSNASQASGSASTLAVPTFSTPYLYSNVGPNFASGPPQSASGQTVSQNVRADLGPSAQLSQQLPLNQAPAMTSQTVGQQTSLPPIPSKSMLPPVGRFAPPPLNQPVASIAPSNPLAYRQLHATPSMPQNHLPPDVGTASQAPSNPAPHPTPHPWPNQALPQRPADWVQDLRRRIEQAMQATHVVQWRAQNQAHLPANDKEQYEAVEQVVNAFKETAQARDRHQCPRSFAHFDGDDAVHTPDEILMVAVYVVNRTIHLHTHGTHNLYFKPLQHRPRGPDAKLHWKERLEQFKNLVRFFKNAANDLMYGRAVDEALAAPVATQQRLDASLAAWNHAQAASQIVAVPPQVRQPVALPVRASGNAPIDLTGNDPWEGNYVPC